MLLKSVPSLKFEASNILETMLQRRNVCPDHAVLFIK